MDKARERDVPAYVIFNDKTLDDLLARLPTTLTELGQCTGIGPAKLDGFGTELLEVIAGATPDGSPKPGADAATGSTPPSTPQRPTAPAAADSSESRPAASSGRVTPAGMEDALKAWRFEKAAEDDVPAYRIFANKTLDELCARVPLTDAELLACSGIGPAKLEAFGPELLALIADLVDGDA